MKKCSWIARYRWWTSFQQEPNIAPFNFLGVYLKIKVPSEVEIDEKFN